MFSGTGLLDLDFGDIRRRLQNGVNQRRLRLRKKRNGDNILTEEEWDNNNRSSVERIASSDLNASNFPHTSFPAEVATIHILAPQTARTKQFLQHFEAVARAQYMLCSPRPDMLLHLIQFNFLKASFQNMDIFGLTHEQVLPDEALSPFNVAGPWPHNFEASLPPTLRATAIQRLIPHHPWLDFLPSPQMRDNLIAAGDAYDEEVLCLSSVNLLGSL
ncbi:hypothetical protein BJX64DRAFT_293837 [Aspergillus heterothallicus]